MKTVELGRFFMDSTTTLGRIKVDGNPISCSVERPWLNNKQGESCIPAGAYLLKKCITSKTMPQKYENVTYEVVGVPGRTHIKFHVLNRPQESEGCIGPNMSIDWATGIGGNSKTATTYFMDAMIEDGKLVDEAILIVTEV